MNEIKFLSINTDASFHHQTKCGGWSFVILGEDIRIIKKGRFKICPDNPTDAEIKCIINAITDLLNKDKLPKILHIVINTDCESIIKAHKKSKKQIYIRLRNCISKLKTKTKCTNLQFKFVRAHTKKQDKYSVINSYVDKWAREKMRESVKIIEESLCD